MWEGESLECQTKAPETIFQQQEAGKLVFEKFHMKIGVFRGLVWQLCGGQDGGEERMQAKNHFIFTIHCNLLQR